MIIERRRKTSARSETRQKKERNKQTKHTKKPSNIFLCVKQMEAFLYHGIGLRISLWEDLNHHKRDVCQWPDRSAGLPSFSIPVFDFHRPFVFNHRFFISLLFLFRNMAKDYKVGPVLGYMVRYSPMTWYSIWYICFREILLTSLTCPWTWYNK